MKQLVALMAQVLAVLHEEKYSHQGFILKFLQYGVIHEGVL